MNNKPVVKHIKAIANVTEVFNPLYLIPTVSHKSLVVQGQILRLMNEQIARGDNHHKVKRFLPISMQTGNAV